jgi:serine phosphatase RsbU (regulator of sigma subunit)
MQNAQPSAPAPSLPSAPAPPTDWWGQLLYCAAPDPETARRGQGFNLILLALMVIIGGTAPLFAITTGNGVATLGMQWAIVAVMGGLYAASRRGWVTPGVLVLLVVGTLAILTAPAVSETDLGGEIVTPAFLALIVILAGVLLPAWGMALVVLIEVLLGYWYYSSGGGPQLTAFRAGHGLETQTLSLAVPLLYVQVGTLAWLANRLISGTVRELRQRNQALEQATADLAGKERLRSEIDIASNIQRRLLPTRLPTLPGLDLAAACHPAQETSGDSYDVVIGAGGAIHLIVSDACGKSVPAALISALCRNTLRAALTGTDDPGAALSEANRLLTPDMLQHQFVAVSCTTLGAASGRLSIANAGQVYPALTRPGKGTTPARCVFVETEGPRLPLGIIPDVTYQARDWPVQAGDLLVCCSDGVIEAPNPAGELFGFDRLSALLETLAEDRAASAETTLAALLATLTAWLGPGNPAPDDLTLVVARLG